MSMSRAQLHAIDSGVLDLIGDSKKLYQPVRLDDVAETLLYVAGRYAEEMANAMNRKDVVSSGKGADSITIQDVEIMGSLYSVSIEANKYLSFVNDGVDGWAQSVGGKYAFKTKGVDPKGKMVKSIRQWLIREGKISRNMNYKPLTNREKKQKTITDTTTREAMRTAFMIKRQGIKPRGFFEEAKAKMQAEVEREFKAAIKVDIINNLS